MLALRDILIAIIVILVAGWLLVGFLVKCVVEPQLKRCDRMILLMEQLIAAMQELTRAVRSERRLE
jgi:hypothetical protein